MTASSTTSSVRPTSPPRMSAEVRGLALGLLDAFSPARKSLAELMMYGRR